MVRAAQSQLKMVVIHATNRRGFFFALVPAALDAAEVDENLKELGIEVSEVFELGGWQTSSQNVAAAFVPFPPNN